MENQDIKETQKSGNKEAEHELDKLLAESQNTRKSRKSRTKKYVKKSQNFQLRGNNINPIIDVSSPLLGLIIRIQSLTKNENVEGLHRKISEEIKAIETELYNQKYDRATILAHRYALCSALDEAVMTTEWGAESEWASNSLLSQFHNETWGGEKFFTILQRLMGEPNRYFDLLEFMYVTLSLGFEGMYRVRHYGRDELNQIIEDVSVLIRKEKGDGDGKYTNPYTHISSKRHKVNLYIPPWVIFSSFIIIMFLIWLGFSISLSQKTLEYEEAITSRISENHIFNISE